MTNRQLVQGFYDEVFNAQNAQAAEKYLAEDYIQHNPGVTGGRQGFIDTFSKVFETGFHFLDIQHIICEDDMVCVHLFARNRKTNEVSAWVADIYRVENGKLAEHWDAIQRF